MQMQYKNEYVAFVSCMENFLPDVDFGEGDLLVCAD